MPHSHANGLWVVDALSMCLAEPSTSTLTQRLYDALRGWIQSGELPVGSALPASRRLATALGLGRNTVLGAIERLVAEGFIVTRPGAGAFVTEWGVRGADTKVATTSVPAKPSLSARGERIVSLAGTLSEKLTVFAPGVPALDRFPQERWQRLLRRHQQRAPLTWFDYQHGGGLPVLREALCDYLRLSRSVRCRPEQILITQGAQQGFELIVRLLSDAGDAVWMEDPGYGGALACFGSAGLDVVPVPVDEEGMNPAAVESDAPAPGLIYLTPSHQYPSGVTMTLARRTALLEIAQRQGAWIIEDDYDSEFRYASAPIASLQGLMTNAPVIYVGTFSKVLYPGLRLGYVVLPEALIEPFRRANARLHREGQYVAQAALADLIVEGDFSRHIARMRELYRQRQALLREVLAPAVAQGLALSEGQAGMHLVARLDSVELETALVRQARDAGIGLSPLSSFYVSRDRSSSRQPGLVLGYAGTDEAEIRRAGGWLSDAWLTLR